ncbi:MAG: hypothetical protein RXR08_14240 [Sulfolobaceae archaeon]
MSEESKNEGHAFTILLKYKQKYKDAEIEFINVIPRSSVEKILTVAKLSDYSKLVEEGNHYVLEDVAVVYEDKEKQVNIAIPSQWMDKFTIIKNIEIVITNKIEMLKKIIQEAVMKKNKNSSINCGSSISLYYNKIIYYTDEVKVDDDMLPEKGFYYVNGNIYTRDKDVLKLASKYIVELNGIKVNNLKELIRIFMKLKDKFRITEDTLANFKGKIFVRLGDIYAVPLYLDGIVIYTNDFKAEIFTITCELMLLNGVIMFGYEWVAASSDVWSELTAVVNSFQ